MRFFLDTEFEERGYEYPIRLISIALTCDKGEYYVQVDDERNWSIVRAMHYGFGRLYVFEDTPELETPLSTEVLAATYQIDPWLIDNVYRHLSLKEKYWKSRQGLRYSLTE